MKSRFLMFVIAMVCAAIVSSYAFNIEPVHSARIAGGQIFGALIWIITGKLFYKGE